jgi:wyosine [tRNA(Phe)-imidazoG37] synthetase (radical SAM superfamily)
MTGASDDSSPFIREVEDQGTMSVTFGPIASRRLGLSLGIDIIPPKTCSYNCIYCQLGRTTRPTVGRRAFLTPEEVLAEVARALSEGPRPDILTFSGSGEPTLCVGMGSMIRLLKEHFDIKVAVLTNGSLLQLAPVREELMGADIVLPSLDAATPSVFEKINRPHPSIRLSEVLDGLEAFRRSFRGELWLEILLVKDLNDSEEEIGAIHRWVQRIGPERVQLNTVVRPPAEPGARPVERERLEEIRSILGPNAEVISGASTTPHSEEAGRLLEERVIQMARRRSLCAEDLHRALGMDLREAQLTLERIARREGWITHDHQGRAYFSPRTKESGVQKATVASRQRAPK